VRVGSIKTIKTHERLWTGKFNIALIVFALATSTFHSVLVGPNDKLTSTGTAT